MVKCGLEISDRNMYPKDPGNNQYWKITEEIKDLV